MLVGTGVQEVEEIREPMAVVGIESLGQRTGCHRAVHIRVAFGIADADALPARLQKRSGLFGPAGGYGKLRTAGAENGVVAAAEAVEAERYLLREGVEKLTDEIGGAGAAPVDADAAVAAEPPGDNLTEPLEGTFLRFSPGSCDLLDIDAELFAAPGTATGLTATRVNLCELVAFIIQLAAAEAEGDLTAEQVAARNFRRVRRILSRRLTPCSACADICACPVCDDCCCTAGLLATLSDSNLSRRVSLAAGPLLLSGVTLLGSAGNVLVLANDEAQRIYFVCVTHIQFLA